jgi:hypothetical protein
MKACKVRHGNQYITIGPENSPHLVEWLPDVLEMFEDLIRDDDIHRPVLPGKYREFEIHVCHFNPICPGPPSQLIEYLNPKRTGTEKIRILDGGSPIPAPDV